MFSALFGWVGGLWNAIKAFFTHIYQWLARHIVRKLIGIIVTAHGIINGILYPLQKWLRRIMEWYNKHIRPIQLAIINVISAVRVMLALLRLLHVQWAAKLDAELQKIQGIVTASITDVVSSLNTAWDFLSLIVEPGMVLRRDFFGASLFSSLAALKRAVWFGANAPLTATDQQAEQDSATLAYQRAPLATLNADGTLATSPAYQHVLNASDKSTADYLRQLQ